MGVDTLSFWQGKRVLVTGATGLVGSWLCRRLVKEKAQTVALVMDHDPQSLLYKEGTVEQLNVISGKLQEYHTLERAIATHAVDTVFHLGAQALVGVGKRAPLETFESNIRGTYHLLEAARQVGEGVLERIVVASSDKAYGDSPNLPYVEAMPVNGRNPYDVSKSCTDLLSFSYASSYGLPIAVARCGNIFGGGDLNWSRIVPGTIRSLLARERPVIRSDGTLIRDYIYVEDIVDAYLALAEGLNRQELKGEAFNFSLDSQVNVLEMVEHIARQMGCEELRPDIRNEARGEIQDQYLSSDKAKSILGWKPRFGLTEGLDRTIAWYRDYLGHGG